MDEANRRPVAEGTGESSEGSQGEPCRSNFTERAGGGRTMNRRAPRRVAGAARRRPVAEGTGESSEGSQGEPCRSNFTERAGGGRTMTRRALVQGAFASVPFT